ncbi:MAG TPA: flagellar protein FlbB [Xanthobacteraceae bacterium]|jgi:flagellar motility protein MotE (MotC chaperone)
MMRFVRELRLIPVVLIATSCLLGLKILGLILDGGFTLADLDFSSRPNVADTSNAPPADQHPKTSWARDMFSFPDVTGSIDSDRQTAARKDTDEQMAQNTAPPVVTPAETRPAEVKPGETKPGAVPAAKPNNAGGRVIQLDQNGTSSPAERAILERLGERRQELDARARELEIRENLVKSAERQLDGRVNQLKGMEQQVGGTANKKEEEETARLKGLVTMYESMKAKDAAKIFDRLEMPILITVVSKIKPRIMADILAQMQPDVAERLTVELANRAAGLTPVAPAAQLPKIEGHPN